MTALLVALGGAVGTLGRYGIGLLLARIPGQFPWGTFAVNVVGSLLIGLVMAGFAARGELDSQARMALTIGVLGGFTTYSAFAYELVFLVEKKQWAVAATYVGLTFALSAAACAAGIALIRGLR